MTSVPAAVLTKASIALAVVGVLAATVVGLPWLVVTLATLLLLASLVATWHYVN